MKKRETVGQRALPFSQFCIRILFPVEVALDVEVLDVDDDRTAVRAGVRVRRLEELGDEAGHLFAAERAVYFDRGLAGKGGADFLAHGGDVRAALVDRGVDELSEERVDIGAHELGGDGGYGEGVAGEALDVEADGAQLADVRLE